MKVKEKIIRKSIAFCEHRIKKIDSILFSNPLSELLILEKKTIETAKKMDAGSPEVLKYLDDAIKKRDKLMRLAKQQQHSIKLIERKAELEFELGQLHRELFYCKDR